MEAAAARGAAAGIYPVDILEDDPEGHREAALAYYARLGKGSQPSAEVLSLPTGEQVKLEASSIRLCTLHHDEPQHTILVLLNPQDTKTVVAVHIKGTWWSTEDVLRTSDPTREGLMKVQSFGERIVLFILNIVIFGRLERKLDEDDMFFLPHSVKEQAKILWRDGAAVGFYTTKRKGSLCGDGTGVCYLLPVFDTVFVRRTHRRQGLGTAMLRDFCETFPEEEALGVSYPMSPAMYQVCRKFLLTHPEERGRLWEVEPPGAWGQRGSIWLKVTLQQSRLPDRESGSPRKFPGGREPSWADFPRWWTEGVQSRRRRPGEHQRTRTGNGAGRRRVGRGRRPRGPAGWEGRLEDGAGRRAGGGMLAEVHGRVPNSPKPVWGPGGGALRAAAIPACVTSVPAVSLCHL